jgi:hypothetical protein
LALFGMGTEAARFAPALKPRPLPPAYVLGVLGVTIVFDLLPYLEEMIRTLRTKKAPVPQGFSA